MKKSEIVPVRFTPAEKAEIKERAAKTGHSVSSFLRALFLKECERNDKADF
jgi:hypothetical protein